MKAWRDSYDVCYWSVGLDVGDLGGHLDVTLRAWAGALAKRVKDATFQVAAVAALLMGVPTHASGWCVLSFCPLGFMAVGELILQSLLPIPSALR